MKPIAERLGRRSRGDFSLISKRTNFPTIDCNYQAFSLDRYHGGADRNHASSFLNISREYFRYEARRNFLVEAAFFLVLTAMLALTFISGALVIIHFLQLPAA
ncbi:MAG TPA: hypothetical protein VGW97_02545 [Chthoniobacterales bacterium]|jgi:hypothetical protein|nr:hypothetical protein [Chthoniobacterales bacterium]